LDYLDGGRRIVRPVPTQAKTIQKDEDKHPYCPQITSWSLRGVNVLSPGWGSSKHAGGQNVSYWSATRRRRDSQLNYKHRAVWIAL
jgi:hypothetical protein